MSMLLRVRAMAARVYHASTALFGRFFCPVCERRVFRFSRIDAGYRTAWKRHGFDHDFADFEMLNGDNYGCPHCSASDRDRFSALVIRSRMAEGHTLGKIVEFAPSRAISAMLRRIPGVTYRSADLYMEGVDDRVDLCDLSIYADESFDSFICSHVLEHVQDDQLAMRELARVLKRGGWGIALVPVSRRLNTVRENPGEQQESERWRQFGQNDHVRLYSRSGFVERLKAAGFHVRSWSVADFGGPLFERCGITQTSVLDVVSR